MSESVITLKVDDLRPGDEIKLLGRCTVISIEKTEGVPDRILLVQPHGSTHQSRVWQWRYSRMVFLGSIEGRGHLATPIAEAVEAY